MLPSINAGSRFRFTRPALLVLAVWFASLPAARGLNPAPDGGYPNSNTAEGDHALDSLTSGTDNTAVGSHALISNSSASNNTAVGSKALAGTIVGNFNTAVGSFALFSNKASFNTAVGLQAMYNNTSGQDNTALALGGLFNNTSGSENTATGVNALFSNTTSDASTATGFDALMNNTSGLGNNADGWEALMSNTAGNANTATGFGSLSANMTGNSNTGMGYSALRSNAAGSGNTAFGHFALVNSTGSSNIALGDSAGRSLTSGDNNIDIGNAGKAGEANTIRIGNQAVQTATFIAGISGVGVTGRQVLIGSNGKLGVAVSSARFKEAIKPMDKASEAILALKPVTFRYKEEIDPEKTPQFGLVAEEVEKVNPDLVGRDETGKVMTVRYEAVNAMLLNEFLKEHHTVVELKDLAGRQQAMIAQQQKQIEGLAAGLKTQAARIQQVSAEVQLSKSAPQVLVDKQ
jgi:Chaperone of endosialidase